MALQGAWFGLSISKAYVEILGGSIRLKSEEGEGTVFYLHPFLQDLSWKKTISSEIVSPVRTDFSKAKIVIAEDDAIRKLISKAIKDYGEETIQETD
jgi:hypothetical protein